jgi:hypothetical protein
MLENGLEDDLGRDGMKSSIDVGTRLRPILATAQEEELHFTRFFIKKCIAVPEVFDLIYCGVFAQSENCGARETAVAR